MRKNFVQQLQKILFLIVGMDYSNSCPFLSVSSETNLINLFLILATNVAVASMASKHAVGLTEGTLHQKWLAMSLLHPM